MTTSEQWRCTYCETWNLVSSPTCLVCERDRPAGTPSPGRPSDAGSRSSVASAIGTVTPPPVPPPSTAPPSATPPAPPMAGYGAPLSRTAPPTNVVYVVAEPTKESRWWVVPAILLVVGLLVVIGVMVGLLLTGGT